MPRVPVPSEVTPYVSRTAAGCGSCAARTARPSYADLRRACAQQRRGLTLLQVSRSRRRGSLKGYPKCLGGKAWPSPWGSTMRRRPVSIWAALALGTLAPVVFGACGASSEGWTPSAVTTSATSPTPTPVEQPTTGPAKGFEVAEFTNPTTVDNTWFPLEPGTHMVYRETIEDGEAPAPGRVHVTDLTGRQQIVESVLVLEQDFSTDALVESELALFAQADDKTIWHLGQYPEVYEDGEIVETPAWVHGVKGAQAGITIRESDQPGDPSSQGWGPEVGWSDRARVIKVDERTCVEAGCYDGVKVTGVQRRRAGRPAAQVLRAPVGSVGWAGNDPTKETLELVSVEALDPAALAKVRAAAQAGEERLPAQQGRLGDDSAGQADGPRPDDPGPGGRPGRGRRAR